MVTRVVAVWAAGRRSVGRMSCLTFDGPESFPIAGVLGASPSGTPLGSSAASPHVVPVWEFVGAMFALELLGSGQWRLGYWVLA